MKSPADMPAEYIVYAQWQKYFHKKEKDMKEILLYRTIKQGNQYKEGIYEIISKTIVDCQDFEKFNKYRWSLANNGYVYRTEHSYNNSKKTTIAILLHREILNLPRKTDRKTNYVDHINHNKLDNRKENLRIVTQQENCFNKKSKNDVSSTFKGVHWDRQSKKWTARINFNNRQHNLGYFDCEIEAAKAYDEKAKELFGEYAYLNFL